jgi:hypothetical protein
MIEQNINQTSANSIAKEESEKNQKINFIIVLRQKLNNLITIHVKNIFNKFRSNKKIFFPVSIVLGLLLLTIVVGLMFGIKDNSTQTIETPLPTFIASPTPQATQQINATTAIENELKTLKLKIKEFDVEQNKIKPPEINFKISF